MYQLRNSTKGFPMNIPCLSETNNWSQFSTLWCKRSRANLTVQMDFAENFSFSYDEEIQAAY